MVQILQFTPSVYLTYFLFVTYMYAQVQIEGFDYVGLGSATSKKDAETNAAKDFCGFLIGAGIIPPDSFPDDLFVSIVSNGYF